ncbi:PadR family transcriptional regulator [Actinoplanes sp. TBRC 11911]|uniref:PadR family transcriptional regulator n=1 Tax=Actinoplanes sp. TBRC 11911 TaxID=2729386 RepID=UPI00145CBC31|nr:PadR family transcriptional regulator [Actinoplanes sp. TBRC 11911]NMO52396.1 PadR family transcriptional regulator [Actinoplanes sp. TBRC 11911]
MPDDLTPTARTILGFLALHPRSGYEIREAAKRSVSFFWGLSDGQLYPQLKVLAAAGLIEAAGASEGPRAKQVWQLTESGRAAFLQWLREPSAPLQTRDENLVKILFAAQLDPAEALRLVAERRASFQWFLDHLDTIVPRSTWTEAERSSSGPTPDLIRDYGLGFARSALAWCDSVEATLRSKS